MKLTTGGLILYSLLAGNDFNNGVDGIGSVTSLAIAQCGFGDTLIGDCKQMLPHQRLMYFHNIKTRIGYELQYNTRQLLTRRETACAKQLHSSTFPSPKALNWFLNPPTSWSDPAHVPDTSSWMLQVHHLPKITQFCLDHVGWSSPRQLLKKFHQKLWRGIIIRMLSSVRVFVMLLLYVPTLFQPFLVYDLASGRLLSPLKQHSEVYPRDTKGRRFAITNATTIKGNNPPNLTRKRAGDLVRITFDVTEFTELTSLNASQLALESLPKTLNVFVPFAMIAAATEQHALIPGFLEQNGVFLLFNLF